MAQKKFDIIIEAVRYSQDGSIQFARGYQRRGDTYSDIRLFSRDELIQALKNGKKIAAGKRQPFLATTFEIHDTISLSKGNDHPILLTGSQAKGSQDHLKGVPIL